MGLGQSYLYIYLDNKDKKCSENGCDVTPSKTLVNGSINFELVTYTIKYNGDSTYYDIYIYDNKEAVSKAPYVFAYCSPTSNQVANKVEVYYSVLSPERPLVISFVTNNQNYNCTYDELKIARWNWASYITEHTFNGDVLPKLKVQYRNVLLNKTIKFAVGDETTIDVTGFQQEIGDDKKNYRIIYKPNGKGSILNSNCLFNHDNENIDGSKQLEVKNGCKDHTASDKKNLIDQYCLTSVKDHFFDGIIVYYHKENGNKYTALYLEFIDLREKDICLKRIDQEGCWWAEDSIKYNSDTELSSQLGEIQKSLKQKSVTVIIDEKRQYNGLEGFEPGTNKVCKKYTHKFKDANEPIIIFARTTISITAKGITGVKAKHVEVYYLNAGGKEDTQPFLIVFDETGDGKDNKKKKPYHFTNSEKFEEWKSFEFKNGEEALNDDKLIIKLEQKIKQIETNGGCIPNIRLLRWYAYEILTGIDPKPPEEKKETKPTKPKIEEPKPPPEELPVWLIVGCVAAGVVLIVTSVVVYGIYWYNTTIKLLT